MNGFLVIALLLCLLKDGSHKAMAWDDSDFFSYCPPSRCSERGPEIRYPFRLQSNNTSSLCGAKIPCIKLGCSGDDTILVTSAGAAIPYKVTDIDYSRGTMALTPCVDDPSPSCGQKIMSTALRCSTMKYRSVELEDPYTQLCNVFNTDHATIVSCLRELTPRSSAADYIFGPISCLSSSSHFSYLVDGDASMSVLPVDCKVMPDSYFLMDNGSSITFKENAEAILNFSGTTSHWYFSGGGNVVIYNCTLCEQGGRRCAFSPHRNQTFCINQGSHSHIKVIAATSSVATILGTRA